MLKLTSVKLLDNLYKKFKISNLDDNFTLQKLINRSMDLYVLNNISLISLKNSFVLSDLYVHNGEFRSTINEYRNLKPSGSSL